MWNWETSVNTDLKELIPPYQFHVYHLLRFTTWMQACKRIHDCNLQGLYLLRDQIAMSPKLGFNRPQSRQEAPRVLPLPNSCKMWRGTKEPREPTSTVYSTVFRVQPQMRIGYGQCSRLLQRCSARQNEANAEELARLLSDLPTWNRGRRGHWPCFKLVKSNSQEIGRIWSLA